MLVALTALGCVGCAAKEPLVVQNEVTLAIPTVTPQAETQYSQEKGGIEISVAPADYTVTTHEEVARQPKPAPVWMSILSSVVGFRCPSYVETTTTQTPVVDPPQLRLLVKINNKMPRVFYGRGTIIQFNAGGRMLAVDQSGYETFLGTIVPPRQEQQIEILGPPLSTLTPPNGIIGIFLYDVVTNQDDAGKVTEKQNFTWYFDYKLEDRTAQTETTTVVESVPAGQYPQEMGPAPIDVQVVPEGTTYQGVVVAEPPGVEEYVFVGGHWHYWHPGIHHWVCASYGRDWHPAHGRELRLNNWHEHAMYGGNSGTRHTPRGPIHTGKKPEEGKKK
jgi:hypothetical protein